MKLSTFVEHLQSLQELNFVLASGTPIPSHFHITEAGLSTKHFVDCGGTIRMEKAISFQLWVAGDTEHRLQASKLLSIIDIALPLFGGEDLPVEMEYQQDTIGRYQLDFVDNKFVLMPTFTACLAEDKCGIPSNKLKMNLSELTTNAQSSCCSPGGGCC